MLLYFIFTIIIFILIIIIESYINNIKNLNNFKNAEYILNKKIDIKIKNIKEENNIPKNILQTHNNKNLVPDYVIDNIKNKNPNWEYHFYDNEYCLKFLKEEYGQIFVDKFNSFKKGAHKSDLFRVCWLYKHGGVYIDIDTEIIVPLDDIVKNINNNLALMINDFRNNYYDDFISDKLNCKHSTLINSFIITNKGNPIIKKFIENIMKIDQEDLEDNYPLILFVMQHTLGEIKDNYQIFERSSKKMIPFINGKMEMIDTKGNKIGNCKYENYKDGKFL